MSTDTPVVEPSAAPAAEPMPTPAPAQEPVTVAGPPPEVVAAAEAARQAAQPPAEPAAQPAEEPTGLLALIGEDVASDPAAAASIDLVNLIIEGKDLDLERAFGRAIEEDDPRFIDEHYLVEVLGEQQAKVLIREATRLSESATRAGERLRDELLKDIPGGQETLSQAVEVFNSVADEATRAVIAELIDSGDIKKMKFAAKQIMDIASASGRVVVHNQQPVGTPGAMQGLSREAYIAAINERNLSPEKYEQLRAQRLLGIKQGL